ncbi:ABC transporter ATP-binding protein [Corynebacterium kroppenstedtii]|uniref:ABC transporter ATP-binding protein n=1 Tax=Corynebacterium sp. PCR 32 TaxID=3351342 RepID=UPI0030B3455E
MTPTTPTNDLHPAAVSVKDLHIRRGHNHIIRGLTFDAQPGTFVAIVGPNGCGKTTALSAIYRATTATSGTITIDDIDITQIPLRESARWIAALPQNEHHELNFTARDIVSFSRRANPTPHDDALIDDALHTTGVAHLAEQPILGVSGGEYQRILLARALAQHTPVLVLDEPTNHLDLHHQVRLTNLLTRLTRHRTIIAAIHDLNIALHADHVVVLDNGRLHAAGPPEETLTPDLINDVFGVDACTITHPQTGTTTLLFHDPDDTQTTPPQPRKDTPR